MTLTSKIGPKQTESYCHLQRRFKDSLSDFPAILLGLMILTEGTNPVISGLRASKWESQPLLSMKARKKKMLGDVRVLKLTLLWADMLTFRLFFSMKKRKRCACL